MVRIGSALGSYSVKLSAHWLSGHNLAVLKYYGCIAEYEVYRANNIAVSVELSVADCIQSVLVGINAATIYD